MTDLTNNSRKLSNDGLIRGPFMTKHYYTSSPDLNLTPLAAFLRFLPSAARVRSDLSQFSWGRSEPKVVRWQIKDQYCFSYPEMMFQINLCYFLCWLVSLLLSWVQWNYSIGGKCCANVRLLQNTFKFKFKSFIEYQRFINHSFKLMQIMFLHNRSIQCQYIVNTNTK